MDDLGTELPQRRGVALALAAGGIVLAVPAVRTASAATGASGAAALGAWVMAVLVALLLVVVPLLLAGALLRRHTYVDDDAVTLVIGGTVRRRVAFSALREVRARLSGQALRLDHVVLVGGQPSDQLLVSLVHVTTLRPLLDRLEREATERPGLLASDVERGYFASVVARSR